jgi:hypothetical protein
MIVISVCLNYLLYSNSLLLYIVVILLFIVIIHYLFIYEYLFSYVSIFKSTILHYYIFIYSFNQSINLSINQTNKELECFQPIHSFWMKDRMNEWMNERMNEWYDMNNESLISRCICIYNIYLLLNE